VFLLLIIAGLHYKNGWIIALGAIGILFYDVKQDLEIICKRPVYYKCIFEKEQSK
jgi:hypothetical protein